MALFGMVFASALRIFLLRVPAGSPVHEVEHTAAVGPHGKVTCDDFHRALQNQPSLRRKGFVRQDLQFSILEEILCGKPTHAGRYPSDIDVT
jgi:hypothetical protein